jgi:hypothetical protein
MQPIIPTLVSSFALCGLVLAAAERPARACDVWRAPTASRVPAGSLTVTHSIYSGRVSPHWSVSDAAAQARLAAALASAVARGQRVSEADRARHACGLGGYLVHGVYPGRGATDPAGLELFTLCPDGTLLRTRIPRSPQGVTRHEAWKLTAPAARDLRLALERTRPPRPRPGER